MRRYLLQAVLQARLVFEVKKIFVKFFSRNVCSRMSRMMFAPTYGHWESLWYVCLSFVNSTTPALMHSCCALTARELQSSPFLIEWRSEQKQFVISVRDSDRTFSIFGMGLPFPAVTGGGQRRTARDESWSVFSLSGHFRQPLVLRLHLFSFRETQQ